MKDFERNMDMLAETEAQGRWIVTPRKGTTFLGRRARAQARARERRRRVLVVLIESIVLTALIGLVPPLRAMWYATAILLVLLGGYVWALLTMKARADAQDPVSTARDRRDRTARVRPRLATATRPTPAAARPAGRSTACPRSATTS